MNSTQRGRKVGENEFYDRHHTGTAYKPCTSNHIRGSNTKCLVLLSSIEYDIPLNREFGLNAAYIDKPITTATALATADIYDKIGEYEPRAEIVSIEFTTDYERGILKPKVEVEVNGEYDEYDEEYTE